MTVNSTMSKKSRKLITFSVLLSVYLFDKHFYSCIEIDLKQKKKKKGIANVHIYHSWIQSFRRAWTTLVSVEA